MKSFKVCKLLPSLIILLTLMTGGCSGEKDEMMQEAEITDYSSLISLFSDPPAGFRSAPFWIWHEIVTEEKIKHSLEELKAKGFGGVFVHPRYGMITEYLSDEWFDLFGYTLEVAADLGMYVWIYDENSYPSGFAGGHVPHLMPDSYQHGQSLRLHKSDRFNPDPNLRYLHFFERDANDQILEITNYKSRIGDPGDFFLLEIVSYPRTKWYGGYSYVDLLFPGVTEKFMEVTMNGYKERFGHHFGKLIPGVFTDEPNIAPPGGRAAVRWTPDIYDEFEKRHGYSLQNNLLSLFEETGDWKQVRHNYYQTMLQMFIERWSKPWFEYTEENDLKWTGHYWEHGWPSPHHGGDNMAMYAWHQIPGIDLLFNTMYTDDRPDQYGRIRNVKELRSAANQTGRTRTLSESFGGSGWEITFEDMKRLGDWMYVLGVNYLNQHMTYMTIVGDRKTDYPQSFSYHTPWWDLYGHQADYFARLSVAMSAGKQKNNVLVIEPTTSAWMYYSSNTPNSFINEIGNSFNNLLERLEQHKILYDLGSENIIGYLGRADKGLFIVGEAEYDLVVLPWGMENIDRSTFTLLGQYLESVGRVVTLGTIPGRIDGMESNEIIEVLKKSGEKWLHASCFTDEKVYKLFENKKLKFSSPAMDSEWFFHHIRDLEDGRLVFLVNSEPENSINGMFSTQGRQVIELDPHTGEAASYPYRISGETVDVEFSIKPAGSLLLFISDTPVDIPAKDHAPEATMVLDTESSTVRPVSPNMMKLDYGELLIDGRSRGNMYFYRAADLIWEHYGFNGNPWFMSVQFKSELAGSDNFQPDTGFEFTYRFEIEEGTNLMSINAAAERPDIFRLSVNGIRLEPVAGRWFVDKDLAVYNIGEHLHAGDNHISLTVKPMSMYAELQPVYLTGYFSLEPAKEGWIPGPQRPLTTGSWKESGYPFYYDRVSYIKQFYLNKVPARVMVQLEEWSGTVAEILVNGRSAGIIQQPPYNCDITKWVVAGENRIEVMVYGSLKNLLGPHHNVTSRGIVRPRDFTGAPENSPPGDRYDLIDYGLMQDYLILVTGE